VGGGVREEGSGGGGSPRGGGGAGWGGGGAAEGEEWVGDEGGEERGGFVDEGGVAGGGGGCRACVEGMGEGADRGVEAACDAGLSLSRLPLLRVAQQAALALLTRFRALGRHFSATTTVSR